ncbi:MAG: DNA polymerase III subunit gamma/tau [PVC group bacterium]
MYQALAIKWRPQQFDQVVGQQHISTTLMNAIKQNRLGHAYLFTGPRGIGKTTLARIFAKSLNCLAADSPTPTPCDRCDSCREIMAGNNLDVMEIDGASNTGVDDVRQLRENVKYAPSRGRNKIYIIDEVHMLSTAAFNALLKTLEEPPPHVKFFFATTEPHKIPDTIVSRCQRFDLRKIPRHKILERLKQILEEENVPCEEEALITIASAAEGGMRDAESLLDQLLVYCDGAIRQQDVTALLGLVPRTVVTEFSHVILAGDLSRIISLVGEIIDQGWNVSQFLSSLIRHFRDLLVISISQSADPLTDVPAEEAREMTKLGAAFTGPRLFFILNELIGTERTIKNAISEQVALEMALIKVAQSRGRVYLDELIARVEELEAGLPSPPANRDEPSGPGEYLEKETDSVPTRSVSEIWPDFLETLGANRPILKAYLTEAEPGPLEDGVLTVYFNEEFDFHREALESPPKRSYMETLLKNKLGFPVRLAFAVRADNSSSREPVETPPSSPEKKKTIIRENPLIESALEMFDGSILEVKE